MRKKMMKMKIKAVMKSVYVRTLGVAGVLLSPVVIPIALVWYNRYLMGEFYKNCWIRIRSGEEPLVD
jgi:hypothetical protein